MRNSSSRSAATPPFPHPAEDGGDDRGDDDVIGIARTYCVSIPGACVFVWHSGGRKKPETLSEGSHHPHRADLQRISRKYQTWEPFQLFAMIPWDSDSEVIYWWSHIFYIYHYY